MNAIKHKDLMRVVNRFAVGIAVFVSALAAMTVATSADEKDLRRVIVSTDIGGTDPDDFQSMVHLFLVANEFELKGLISSPWGEGTKEDILKVVDLYEQDYSRLAACTPRYPTPGYLRGITKQGATEYASYAGFGKPTEGSQLLVGEARKDDPRPLYVLVWGGIEDLAQALHDAPDILPKLRVYYIGGPNKKWAPHAYEYIAQNHPDLWIIEANATYRGWFVGGDQSGDWGNKSFVEKYIAGQGAMGDFFLTQLEGVIKMGDTPSVVWAMEDTPLEPESPGWGGSFVRAWKRGDVVANGLTTADDTMERYGILELVLDVPEDAPVDSTAWLKIDNQRWPGHFAGDGKVRFRFSPKNAATYSYTVESSLPSLDGKTGAITAVQPTGALVPDEAHPNWWTDNPDEALMDGTFHGTRTVNRWRRDFLSDFAHRIAGCD